jgi:hypothetical protein
MRSQQRAEPNFHWLLLSFQIGPGFFVGQHEPSGNHIAPFALLSMCVVVYVTDDDSKSIIILHSRVP